MPKRNHKTKEMIKAYHWRLTQYFRVISCTGQKPLGLFSISCLFTFKVLVITVIMVLSWVVLDALETVSRPILQRYFPRDIFLISVILRSHILSVWKRWICSSSFQRNCHLHYKEPGSCLLRSWFPSLSLISYL